jgi:arylsulfatase A-like enzyme
MTSDKPNILLIMADDIGWFDVGAYHRGVMGAVRRILTGRHEGALVTVLHAHVPTLPWGRSLEGAARDGPGHASTPSRGSVFARSS